MGLRDVARRLNRPHDEIERERLADRVSDEGRTPIADAPLWAHVVIGGEIVRTRITPRSGVPAFEAVVADGTGEMTIVFTGRRSIAGLSTGRALLADGLPRAEKGRTVMLNPAYTLLPG